MKFIPVNRIPIHDYSQSVFKNTIYTDDTRHGEIQA